MKIKDASFLCERRKRLEVGRGARRTGKAQAGGETLYSGEMQGQPQEVVGSGVGLTA